MNTKYHFSQNQHNDALSILIKNHSDELYRFIFTSLKDNFLVDDIVSLTFIKIHETLYKGEDIQNPRAWLFKCAYRNMIDVLRHEKSRYHVSSDLHTDYISETIPTAELINYKQEIENLHILLERCGIHKKEDKDLMILFLVFEFSLTELSEQFNEKPNTLSVRIKRLRERFKLHYGKLQHKTE